MNTSQFEKIINDLDLKCMELSVMERQTFSRCKGLEDEINRMDSESVILDKVANLFKHLLDVLLDKKKKDIEQLVTYGLKTVVDDQDLKFHIDIEPKYNSIYTTFRTEHVGVMDGNVLDNFGGGIVNIQSFLLRIITLFQTKLSPYLILDESFSNLSEDYVENCSHLLKSLCDQLGLTILLVTHQPLMLSHADKVYKASSKDNKLFLEETKSYG
jgi:DNA repair exonuclease SbcCD ATPase subunit